MGVSGAAPTSPRRWRSAPMRSCSGGRRSTDLRPGARPAPATRSTSSSASLTGCSGSSAATRWPTWGRNSCAPPPPDPAASALLGLEELLEVALPEDGVGVRAVPVGVLTEGDDDGAALRHAADLALEDAKLGRVDEVVGGVHRQQRRLDLLKCRTRVVVVRGPHG